MDSDHEKMKDLSMSSDGMFFSSSGHQIKMFERILFHILVIHKKR